MAKRYLLNKKFWKIKTWICDVARLTAAWKNYGAPVEKLCWSGLSLTLNLFHPPCTFLARKSVNLIANFSATMVTSLPSFSLSLSVSLSLSHRVYLTHNIGSASAPRIIGSAEGLSIMCVRYFRWERERDGSDVTNVALKLAMNLHFPLPKIRTIGDELTLSLAKNSHFSFFPSHFPSLPSRRGHHCGAKIRNEFTLSIAKISPSLFPLFQIGHEPRRVIENPRQMIINTKNYWK